MRHNLRSICYSDLKTRQSSKPGFMMGPVIQKDDSVRQNAVQIASDPMTRANDVNQNP